MSGQRLELEGLPGSKGRVLGRATVRYPAHFEIEHGSINADEVANELAHFERALNQARAELDQLSHRLRGALSKDIAELMHAHRLILDDPEFAGAISHRIKRQHLRASTALKMQRDELAAMFEAMEDPYLRSRREDVDQVALRLYNALKHGGVEQEKRAYGKRAKVEILVCETIAPDELAQAHEHGLKALVLTGSSIYSHTSILARSLNLPLVCGIATAFDAIPNAAEIVVCGDLGTVIVHPDVLDRRQVTGAAKAKPKRESSSNTPLQNAQGVAIELQVNAERDEDIRRAMALGAAGVGLFRTEFLYLGRRAPPDEDEQYRIYKAALRAAKGRPVTFRTLDLGADKANHAALEVMPEVNPALGLRGIRLSLTRPALFRNQLRALLRASAHGNMRVLLPMVSEAKELSDTRQMMLELQDDLRRQRQRFSAELALGAMIEVPAAALCADRLAQSADFFAIGSNDLAQYLLAADRNNDAVSPWYRPDAEAIWRLLQLVVRHAKAKRRPVSVCGEMASDPNLAKRLVAIGIHQLSMHVNALNEVRVALSNLAAASSK